MFLQAVFSTLFQRASRRPRPRAADRPRYRPQLEPLEDRTVPSGLQVVPSPAVNGTLNKTTVIAANDMWAVGSFTPPGSSVPQALAEHFNGTAWSTVPLAALPSGDYGQLYGVTAVASNNVWAVGSFSNVSSSTRFTLVEHWDGSKWNLVSSPTPSVGGQLNTVTALAANNIWAGGTTGGANLMEHFDGTAWSIVTVPTPQRQSSIASISAISSTDIWAVGAGGKYASGEALHYNGTAWSIVTTPQPFFQGSLSSVVALAPNNVWAVGAGEPRTGPSGEVTVIEHWDGTSWTIVPSPNVSPSNTSNFLTGIAAVSATNIWAVGYYTNSTGTHTLTEHWDGTSWSIIPSPDGAAAASILSGVAATSTGTVVAVGESGQNPLILQG
jgi:hypothetical protein